MSRRLLAIAAGIVVIILAGIGFGYGGARWWRTQTPLSSRENVPQDTIRLAQGSAEQAQDAGPELKPNGKNISKRALLVGVTKYYHLSKENQLAGPANDARLMQRLLRERYQFPEEGIVTLTEDEVTPERKPTRANVERELRRLVDQAREGDQVVILLSGHGYRQPENDPPDPQFPEPDGLDEIFLPADVSQGKGTPMRVPNAIVDNELGKWLRAITAKKAHVWIVFDCCHSGTMTRGTEVVRELPPDTLIPHDELDKARAKAAQRAKTHGGASPPSGPFLAREPSDYLVALYACRSHETTPECPLPGLVQLWVTNRGVGAAEQARTP
jgi:hypothetical protein